MAIDAKMKDELLHEDKSRDPSFFYFVRIIDLPSQAHEIERLNREKLQNPSEPDPPPMPSDDLVIAALVTLCTLMQDCAKARAKCVAARLTQTCLELLEAYEHQPTVLMWVCHCLSGMWSYGYSNTELDPTALYLLKGEIFGKLGPCVHSELPLVFTFFFLTCTCN